jgi:maleamate amidohydrolase
MLEMTTIHIEDDAYQRQGFGAELQAMPPFGVLIVDFVNGFADPGTFGGGNIQEAIQNTSRLLSYARSRNWPIAHSRIVYADDAADKNIFAMKVPTLLALTEDDPGSAIVDELTPARDELVVRKTVPSAFFGTVLSPWLTQRGVKTLLVAGATTSGCVRASVVDAMCHGFKPIVIADCVGDRALGPHEANLFDMRQKYASVLRLDEVLALSAVAK